MSMPVNEPSPRVQPLPVLGRGTAPSALIFVQDRGSEDVIRQSLADLKITDATFMNGGIAAAVNDLARRPSPRLLIVDVVGAADLLAQIKELAEVCDPTTGLIVIGESNDIAVYRNLKDAGVVEYFFKPLVRNLVTRACSTILTGEKNDNAPRTGKLVLTLSVHGGVGATTILTRSAWHLAMERDRKILLIDLDVYTGDVALQLDAVPTHALREALEYPDRVDDLFLERGVNHVTPRIDLLASLEPFENVVPFHEDAILTLLGRLLHRYRYIFVDIPMELAEHAMKVMRLPSICLLISDGRLVSARDVARWKKRIGPNTPERTTLHILNKSGAPGSLPMDQFIKAAGQEPEIIIPYDRDIELASALGMSAIARCGTMTRALAPLFRDLGGVAIDERPSLLSRLFG